MLIMRRLLLLLLAAGLAAGCAGPLTEARQRGLKYDVITMDRAAIQRLKPGALCLALPPSTILVSPGADCLAHEVGHLLEYADGVPLGTDMHAPPLAPTSWRRGY